jgi:hypothetical protein
MTAIITIFEKDEELDVEFEFEYRVENDSFTHEFGTEKYSDYVIIEQEPTWDRTQFSKEENEMIERVMSDYNSYAKLEKELLVYAEDDLESLKENY